MPILRNSRRQFLAGLSVTFLLAGCGDDEPKQRKAFIEFLQTRIVDKPGVHVPRLNDDQATPPSGEQWRASKSVSNGNAGSV